jgi:UDP-N-acetylglucosamine:LPS N-acetylglucosamine transferase
MLGSFKIVFQIFKENKPDFCFGPSFFCSVPNTFYVFEHGIVHISHEQFMIEALLTK